ncbi:MAG: carboxymuconolactone decarboxylase family protein [Spirochaetales bacterium]|nr:carboxymuconolactone decarboxylase family protein [Spirochaetales bacterium]
MDESFDNKIKEIRQGRKHFHNSFVSLDLPVYKAFLKMEKAAFTDRVLPKRTKELVAVGISIAINCESCMEWHIGEALRSGAKEAEILEVIEVGMEMGGGPATVSSRFALKVLEYYREHGQRG